MIEVRREKIPLLWSTVGETALAKSFCSNMGDMEYPCVCRRMKLLDEVYTVIKSENA